MSPEELRVLLGEVQQSETPEGRDLAWDAIEAEHALLVEEVERLRVYETEQELAREVERLRADVERWRRTAELLQRDINELETQPEGAQTP